MSQAPSDAAEPASLRQVPRDQHRGGLVPPAPRPSCPSRGPGGISTPGAAASPPSCQPSGPSTMGPLFCSTLSAVPAKNHCWGRGDVPRPQRERDRTSIPHPQPLRGVPKHPVGRTSCHSAPAPVHPTTPVPPPPSPPVQPLAAGTGSPAPTPESTAMACGMLGEGAARPPPASPAPCPPWAPHRRRSTRPQRHAASPNR